MKVFDGATGAVVNSFFAFAGFAGGVDVTGGDINADGFDDIIVGAGHVKCTMAGPARKRLASSPTTRRLRLPPELGGVAQHRGDPVHEWATFVAPCSGILDRAVQSEMVLGSMNQGGSVVPVENLAKSLQVAFDAGAKRVLLPMASVRDLPTISPGKLRDGGPRGADRDLAASPERVGGRFRQAKVLPAVGV